MSYTHEFNTFDGLPEASIQRFRQITEEACAVLPSERLNMLAWQAAAYIDEETSKGLPGRTVFARAEAIVESLDHEQAAMAKAWGNLELNESGLMSDP